MKKKKNPSSIREISRARSEDGDHASKVVGISGIEKAKSEQKPEANEESNEAEVSIRDY